MILDALDALHAAFHARDVAVDHAVARVHREYAAIIHQWQQEFSDAVRREQEASKCAG